MPTHAVHRDALLLSIEQTATSAFVTIDSSGTVLSFGPSAETMFGFRHEEIVGRNVAMLMTKEHRAHHDDYIARYLRTGEARVIGHNRVLPARHKTGREFPIRLSVGEFAHGGDVYFVGIIENLTQFKAVQESLEAVRRKLEKQSQIMAMAVLSSSLAHELNQPLTGATSLLEAIDILLEKEGRPGNEPVRRHLREAIDEIHWAASILRKARQIENSGEPNRQPVDLNTVVRDSIVLATRESHANAIDLKVELADDLPPTAVDRVHIQQVIINLMRNAADAVGSRGGGTIEVRTHRDDSEIVITVADDGPGIAGDVADQMFEAFVTTKPDGLGLGLAISKLLVEAHGGTIAVEPRSPHGVVVSVRLPSS